MYKSVILSKVDDIVQLIKKIAETKKRGDFSYYLKINKNFKEKVGVKHSWVELPLDKLNKIEGKLQETLLKLT